MPPNLLYPNGEAILYVGTRRILLTNEEYVALLSCGVDFVELSFPDSRKPKTKIAGAIRHPTSMAIYQVTIPGGDVIIVENIAAYITETFGHSRWIHRKIVKDGVYKGYRFLKVGTRVLRVRR